MNRYRIELTPKAYRDIEDIYAYIAVQKESPSTGKQQTDRIWRKIKSLEYFPQSHQERIVGKYANKGYRQLLIDNYIAVYRIDEENKSVYIITVQYFGRNL